MPRLYRPVVPVEVKCRVALRQLGTFPEVIDRICAEQSMMRTFGATLDHLLLRLSGLLNCDVSELRLDHDPPLAARPKHRRGLGKKTHYIPDANDPEHLFYRPHGPQHAKSHLIKTNVRGDHGQHPDRVLIKKARKLERGPKPKRGPKIRSRGFAASSKPKWPRRPFNQGGRP
jgi:hypothetical protein